MICQAPIACVHHFISSSGNPNTQILHYLYLQARELSNREIPYVACGYLAAVWKMQYLRIDAVVGLIVMLHSATHS